MVLTILIPIKNSFAVDMHTEMKNSEEVKQVLDNMTAEERVGQLFLVTFKGATADIESQIYDLIVNHHIGGMVLSAQNDNFTEGDDILTNAYDLIFSLQTSEWRASQAPMVDPISGDSIPNQYIPLFIGISQPGGGGLEDQLKSGLTTLPNEMAIGATWDTNLAEQVGVVAGAELSQVGFNLLLGPSLDVLESPEATLSNGLGAGVFGGDPFWVGQLGQAYIRGVHSGSEGKILVIARNFPGRGSSDRPTGEEPATVRKLLEALKQIELAPFFSVTGNAPNQLSTADGLLVSHIRYQGFQGNIRATTRPVSFDSQALTQILALPEFTTWNEEGGLLISDDLGSKTIRQFYDPSGTSFQARLVARDAFLAGNDILYLGNIQSSSSADNYETVLNILAFFSQKYREDTAFAQRVDSAVERILALKLTLYGKFQLADVIPQRSGLEDMDLSQQITFEVARHAATLVSPGLDDLETLIPEPPASTEDIVFITDTRSTKQCSECTPVPILDIEEMENAVLRLYGPLAGGEVSSRQLNSLSLDDIAVLLNGEGDASLEFTIKNSNWLVINILESKPGEEYTETLKRFLSERQDLLRNKYVILFSFDAPFYLDSTDISKLTAYYCLYSSSAPFVEVAVRLLFQELTPEGALPVSVSSVGYDLFHALTPDPDQIITLSIDIPPIAIPTEEETPITTPTQFFQVGDIVTVRTGVLIDRNGNPVPDGTEVHFMLSAAENTVLLNNVEAVTSHGVASASFKIDTPGILEIRATSEPATVSMILQFDVSGEGILVTIVAPTPITERTPIPDNNTIPTVSISPISQGKPGIISWVIMTIILIGSSTLIVFLTRKVTTLRWKVRMGLCTAAGCMSSYTYLALQLPGVENFLKHFGYWGILSTVLLGAICGGIAGYIWLRADGFSGNQKPRRRPGKDSTLSTD